MPYQPTRNKLALTGLISAAVLLSACSSKPPSCGDEQTVQVIRSIAVDNAKKIIAPWASMYPDAEKAQETYFQSLKAELSNVVSEGYNSDAKKYTCNAKLSFTTIKGEKLSHDIAYITQKTEDKEGFVVQVAAFNPVAMAIAGDFISQYRSTLK